MPRLASKVAVVTGSGGAIGRAEALLLAKEGAAVVISDIGKTAEGKSTAEIVAEEIRGFGGRAVAVSHDLASMDGARRTIEAAVDTFGSIGILVNNAGLRAAKPVDQLTEDDWDAVVGSHLKASFATIKYAVPFMRKNGGGCIINTGSEAGMGMIFNAAYAAAKEGIAGLTRTVAREQGRFGIRCNLVRPRTHVPDPRGGKWGRTKLYGEWMPMKDALGPYWIGERGLAEWGVPATPEQVAGLIAWLCTSQAENVNGQDFYVGGDEVALVSMPKFERSLIRPGGWDIDALSDTLPGAMTGGLVDHFRIENPLSNDD
ncbi:SDR family oxidoreductase [soil metagenome]